MKLPSIYSRVSLGKGIAIGQEADSIAIHSIFTDDVPYAKGVFTRISCGTNHALILDASRRLFAVGSNRFGQCGNNSSADQSNAPSLIATGVDLVVAGPSSSFYTTNDGLLFAFGDNKYNQLGIGGSSEHAFIRTPTHVDITLPISSISCGFSHTCIVSGGKLYGSGFNSHGQLDFLCERNDVSPSFRTSANEFPFRIEKVSCGLWCTGILTANGELYICGQPPEFQDKPQSVDDLLAANDERWNRRSLMPARINGMQRLPFDVKFSEFVVGSSIALGLLEDRRTLWVIDLVDYQVLETFCTADPIRHISINDRYFSFS